jgi:hypothetical protein
MLPTLVPTQKPPFSLYKYKECNKKLSFPTPLCLYSPFHLTIPSLWHEALNQIQEIISSVHLFYATIHVEIHDQTLLCILVSQKGHQNVQEGKSIWEPCFIILNPTKFTTNSFDDLLVEERLICLLSGKVTNVRDYTLK